MKKSAAKSEVKRQTSRPGSQRRMKRQPDTVITEQAGTGLLKNKVALVTGGDSGIGRAVAVAFAREGAFVAVSYLNEHKDAAQTEKLIQQAGGECVLFAGDIGDESFAKVMVNRLVKDKSRVDILVNNAGEQHPQDSVEHISRQQLTRTFTTNVFSMFYLVQAAVKYMPKGSTIINTTSVTAYKGHPILLDYSATKGAIVALTRSLALSLADKEIRVNAVAPGPIWTPLIPSTFDEEQVAKFGKDTPLGRPGEPDEVAAAYVFLASSQASYITGQTIHVNGGSIVNS